MRSLFIMHGSYGTPAENWFPWLAEQWTDGNDGLAITPAFPTPRFQTFENWARIMDAYAEAGVLGEDSVVVAHSSAAAFALKYAIARAGQFRGLVTAAGFNGFQAGDPAFDRINAEMYIEPSQFEEAQASFRQRWAFFADNDPNLPAEVLERFASELGAEKRVIEGGGHLNAAAGFSEFPALWDVVQTLR